MLGTLKAWIPGLLPTEKPKEISKQQSRSSDSYTGRPLHSGSQDFVLNSPYHPHTSANSTPYSNLINSNLGGTAHHSATEEVRTRSSFSPFTFLYRLTGLWFITVAAGSVMWSIPIGAIGLPVIIGMGTFALIIGFIASLVLKVWLYLLKSSWKAIKSVFFTPLSFLEYALKKVTGASRMQLLEMDSLENGSRNHSNAAPPPSSSYGGSQRRFSSSSRITDRSYDGAGASEQYKWRYYDPIGQDIANPVYNPATSSPKVNVASSPSLLSDTMRRFDEFDHGLQVNPRVLNAAFYELTPDQRDRLEMCAQLYSLTTNIPMDQVELQLGPRLDTGNIHYILSLWNEPAVNEPLELSHLIGFCESFYKSLGFRNALEYPSNSARDGRRPRKVEGEHGPLLVWHADQKMARSEPVKSDSGSFHAFDHPPLLRHHDSQSSLRSTESFNNLRHKESIVSLRGGVGAVPMSFL
ncbi:hypothetical protein HDV03_004726 [Kappamyces sp. JEL0829]|nr:hypothetical protein HDV03_004726 [Kappamyces sp. JEL0829]